MATRSDKTHGHKPRRHIKLLLFLTGCGSSSCARYFPSILVLALSLSLSSFPPLPYVGYVGARDLDLPCPTFVPSPSLSFSLPLVFLFVFFPPRVPLSNSVSWHTIEERYAGLSLFSIQTCVLPAAAHAPTRRPLIPFHEVLPLPRGAWVLPRMGDVHSRMVSLVDGYEHSSRRVCEKRLTNRHAINKAALRMYQPVWEDVGRDKQWGIKSMR